MKPIAMFAMKQLVSVLADTGEKRLRIQIAACIIMRLQFMQIVCCCLMRRLEIKGKHAH